MKNILYLLLLLLLVSCKHETRETIDIYSIQVPSYYKTYDYKKFWTAKGFDFTFTPTPKGRCLKDSASQHFLRIENSAKAILQIDKEVRYDYMIEFAEEHERTIQSIIKDDFEMYWGQSSDSLYERRDHHYTTLYFLKDTIGTHITYTTLKPDDSKLQDYYKLIKDIREKYE